MAQGPPPAPQKAMNPTLKWVLIGCGGFLLFVLVVVSVAAFLFIRKARQVKADLAARGIQVDTSRGLRGTAFGLSIGLVRSMEPTVQLALPKAEHPAANKAFRDLAAKGPAFTHQDMQDLDSAMRDYHAATKALTDAGKPPIDTEAARQFVKAIQAIADRH